MKSKVLSTHRIMSFVNKHFFMICSGHINILEGKLSMALVHKILSLTQTKKYLISTKVKAMNPWNSETALRDLSSFYNTHNEDEIHVTLLLITPWPLRALTPPLPLPMWARFISQCQCHMWVKFVVGFLLCSERFFSRPGTPAFPSPQKPTSPNSTLTRNQEDYLR